MSAGEVIAGTGLVIASAGIAMAAGCDDFAEDADGDGYVDEECDAEDQADADPETGLVAASVGAVLIGLGALIKATED